MFDNLVVSTAHRRRGRTAKFFVCTSITYLSVVAIAFALSVMLATPKLADTAPAPPGPIFLLTSGTPDKPDVAGPPTVAPTKDPRYVESLDQIITKLSNPRPTVIQNAVPPRTEIVGGLDQPGAGGTGIPGMPASTGLGVGSGSAISDAPKPPDAPKPQPRAVDNSKPLPVSSTVLQGKAIERVVPVYPELPRRIHLHGDVSLEVIISPEGRVESVRVVSGHPMLVNSALEAARRWRFEPTLLNGVPVRVTGVITFVFKLSE